MSIKPTYTATCRRISDWWAISVPEIKGVHTQAKRLDQVEGMARDAIATMLDVAPGEFEVRVEPDVPVEVAEATQARAALKQAEERADKATTDAVLALLRHGFTVRDAGRVLGLSYQRVSQIATRSKDWKQGGSAVA